MKYFVAILIILAVAGGYCLGTLDEKSVEESYKPPITLNYVILNMEVARDSHQRYLDDPDYQYWLDWFGSSVEQEAEWVRLYDMTIEILEGLKGDNDER